MEVTIALADGGAAPCYRRRFLPAETEEVRVYLHGGNDRVTRTGARRRPGPRPRHRRGRPDVVDDSQSGGTDVWPTRGRWTSQRGDGTQVRRNAWTNPGPVKDAPWLEPRSYGHVDLGRTPVFAYHGDIELVLGYGAHPHGVGLPHAASASVRAGAAGGDRHGRRASGRSSTRAPSGVRLGSGLTVRRRFASTSSSLNFFGYGNDTPDETDGEATTGRADGAVRACHGDASSSAARLEAFLGPEVRYSKSITDRDTILSEAKPVGFGDMGRVAVRGGFEFDSRSRPAHVDSEGEQSSPIPIGESPKSVTGITIRASDSWCRSSGTPSRRIAAPTGWWRPTWEPSGLTSPSGSVDSRSPVTMPGSTRRSWAAV